MHSVCLQNWQDTFQRLFVYPTGGLSSFSTFLLNIDYVQYLKYLIDPVKRKAAFDYFFNKLSMNHFDVRGTCVNLRT